MDNLTRIPAALSPYSVDNSYLVFKALHIISFTAWLAALFYLPRLYVYHAAVKIGSETDILLQTMERRLQINEIPTILLIAIVLLAVLKPF